MCGISFSLKFDRRQAAILMVYHYGCSTTIMPEENYGLRREQRVDCLALSRKVRCSGQEKAVKAGRRIE
jgi:hypothetical protein